MNAPLAVLLAVLTGTVTGCGALQTQRADGGDSMIGCWTGGGPQPLLSGPATWQMQQLADGTFTIWFYVNDPVSGQVVQEEKGSWKISGTRYVVLTTEIDGNPTEEVFVDKYEILRSDRDLFVYRDKENGAVYEARRIGSLEVCPNSKLERTRMDKVERPLPTLAALAPVRRRPESRRLAVQLGR